MKSTGIKIPSLDGKDLYLANHAVEPKGYSLYKKDGSINLAKFKNTLDYSLDSEKLREVYLKVYRNKSQTRCCLPI